MSDLEFDVILEDEDLFDDEAEKRFMEEFAPEPKPVPKKEFISTKAGLADLARKAKEKQRQESYEKKVLKNPSENFKKQVKVLADHIIECCVHNDRCLNSAKAQSRYGMQGNYGDMFRLPLATIFSPNAIYITLRKAYSKSNMCE